MLSKYSKCRCSIKKISLPELSRPEGLNYFGMADRLPVQVPSSFTRSSNTSHTGDVIAITDDQKFSYGTAGFRHKAEFLPFIVYRSGYLAGLRARQLNKTIGVMITASHNPEGDNGVKIVDPMGEMLAAEWEKFASELVNASDEQLPTAVRALEVQTDVSNSTSNARVVCAIDTRESGPHLLSAARAGVELMGVQFIDCGIMTTPQLHYIVRTKNDPSFGDANELGYFARLTDAFKQLHAMTPTHKSYSPELHVDCANGVGAQKMRMLKRFLPQKTIEFNFHNEDGALNERCGADFVKIDRRLPSFFDFVEVGVRCASLDGDADRLVYFYPTGDDYNVKLLDGDKIAILFAKYITEQLSSASLLSTLSLGIVQTAYANGNSSNYIREKLGLEPVFVPTGVKHLHHAAMKFDIGIYFEANGHGTVCFSDKFKDTVKRATAEEPALLRLKLISQVINEVVGDAISDLLATELILMHYGWSVIDWDTQLYTDAPNIQIKVPVADRSIFKTTFDETTLLEPEGLQQKIDELVKEMNGQRAFVRPSGTENIVRVYAEGSNTQTTKELGESIAEMIRQL